MVFPKEILINKNTQVFDVSFRLETNTFIFFIIKRAQFWLVRESLLVGMNARASIRSLHLNGFFSAVFLLLLKRQKIS